MISSERYVSFKKLAVKINSIDNIRRYINAECLAQCTPLIGKAYDPAFPGMRPD